ncbi:sensor domain-containing diguanylate cyclase [Brevibacillus nitrificans]|uniref:sensor domain-containing diguanylate cyclase n=1 Tax=Brevibacillus nitrificans TaxID=651560 RepID=UPI002866CE21|nr:sensor domain-containing diguanylate cyclase [Brevibacillus nitrificans]MDR7318020.1 diguanylate cyclase (GGDEF)-like protein/PAS domain S-box-containing protein [Brevibacillus nitrificans]
MNDLFMDFLTSLLPEYQMQIVLYGNGPMLLLIICFLVHLCILIGSPATISLKRWLPVIYTTPFFLLFVFLMTKDHRLLYSAAVTDGRSPLDPLFLLLTVLFVAGYILLSVLILIVSWFRTRELKRKKILLSLLLSLFALFSWFVLVTSLLQMKDVTSRNAMILYFVGYLFWGIALRHLIGKHDLMPDYRKLFHILFQSAPNAILLLDKKGVIREMNPKAKQWFEGIPRRDILSHFQFDDQQNLGDRLALFCQGKEHEAQREVRIYNPSRGYMDLIMGIDLIEGNGEELFVIHLTDATSLKETERRLLESERSYKYLAHHDSLTDLYNRTGLQVQLEQKIEIRELFALVLIDLDHFKPINDTYGHFVGDLYLKHIAHMLTRHAQPGDLIGRIGGDEFVLVISCMDPRIDVNTMVHERLSLLKKHAFNHEGIDIPITFSAGVGLFPKDASDITTLLKIADEAMYRVKRASKMGM